MAQDSSRISRLKTQYGHALQILDEANRRRFTRGFFLRAGGELREPRHGLDDAKHGFDRLLAQGIKRFSGPGLELVADGLGSRRILWQGRRFGKAFPGRGMVLVSPDGNERRDVPRFAGLDIPGAGTPCVLQDACGLAERNRKGLSQVWRRPLPAHRHVPRLFTGQVEPILCLRSRTFVKSEQRGRPDPGVGQDSDNARFQPLVGAAEDGDAGEQDEDAEGLLDPVDTLQDPAARGIEALA